MNAACFAGSSLREIAFGLRCSIPRRCNSAIRPDRVWYSIPRPAAIHAPTTRVVRGRVAAIQAFSLSCCSTVSRQLPPSWLKLVRPSIPSSGYRWYQLRTVSSSSNSTLATASQLIPSSNNTSTAPCLFLEKEKLLPRHPPRRHGEHRRHAWIHHLTK